MRYEHLWEKKELTMCEKRLIGCGKKIQKGNIHAFKTMTEDEKNKEKNMGGK